jgi:hypothetical protein
VEVAGRTEPIENAETRGNPLRFVVRSHPCDFLILYRPDSWVKHWIPQVFHGGWRGDVARWNVKLPEFLIRCDMTGLGIAVVGRGEMTRRGRVARNPTFLKEMVALSRVLDALKWPGLSE